jgi:hypothetical protein
VPAIHIRYKGRGRQAAAEGRYTIIYSHGNAEDIGENLGWYAQLANATQADVVGYEYPVRGL